MDRARLQSIADDPGLSDEVRRRAREALEGAERPMEPAGWKRLEAIASDPGLSEEVRARAQARLDGRTSISDERAREREALAANPDSLREFVNLGVGSVPVAGWVAEKLGIIDARTDRPQDREALSRLAKDPALTDEQVREKWEEHRDRERSYDDHSGHVTRGEQNAAFRRGVLNAATLGAGPHVEATLRAVLQAASRTPKEISAEKERVAGLREANPGAEFMAPSSAKDEIYNRIRNSMDEYAADSPWSAVGADVVGSLVPFFGAGSASRNVYTAGKAAAQAIGDAIGSTKAGAAVLKSAPAQGAGRVAASVDEAGRRVMSGRISGASALGAGMGGASGFLESRKGTGGGVAEDALTTGAIGAGAGAAFGAAAPYALRGGKWLLNLGLGPAERSARSSDDRAKRTLNAAMHEYATRRGVDVDDVPRMVEDTLRSASGRRAVGGSSPMRVIDTLGMPGKHLGQDVVANSEMGDLQRFFTGRQEGGEGMKPQAERLRDEIMENLQGRWDDEDFGKSAQQLADELDTERAAANRKNFGAAQEDAANLTGDDRMVDSSPVQEAIERIIKVDPWTGEFEPSGVLPSPGEKMAREIGAMLRGTRRHWVDSIHYPTMKQMGKDKFFVPPRGISEQYHEDAAAAAQFAADFKRRTRSGARRRGRWGSRRGSRASRATASTGSTTPRRAPTRTSRGSRRS